MTVEEAIKNLRSGKPQNLRFIHGIHDHPKYIAEEKKVAAERRAQHVAQGGRLQQHTNPWAGSAGMPARAAANVRSGNLPAFRGWGTPWGQERQGPTPTPRGAQFGGPSRVEPNSEAARMWGALSTPGRGSSRGGGWGGSPMGGPGFGSFGPFQPPPQMGPAFGGQNSLGMLYQQPYINFNGFYSEYELEDVADASREAFNMGIHGFEMYTQNVERTLGQINQFHDSVMNSLPEIRNDLLNYTSVVKEQAKANLDRNLKNQASRLATMSGGPAALMVAQMNKEANKMSLDSANTSQLQRLEEDNKRKEMYYDVVNQRMAHVGRAQETMTKLINQWGALDVNMAQAGLQGQVNTVRNLVSMRMQRSQHEIERDKMQIGWNATLLNSQTSVYNNQLRFMSERFNSMTSAQAQMYNAHTRARAEVYKANTEHNATLQHAMIGAQSGLYEAGLNNTSRERIAGLQLGSNLYNTNAQLQMGAWRSMYMSMMALRGIQNNVVSQLGTDIMADIKGTPMGQAAVEAQTQSVHNTANQRAASNSGLTTEQLRKQFEETINNVEGVQ